MVSYGDRNDLVFSQSTLYLLILLNTETNVNLDINYVMISSYQLLIMKLNRKYACTLIKINKFISDPEMHFSVLKGLYFEREFA